MLEKAQFDITRVQTHVKAWYHSTRFNTAITFAKYTQFISHFKYTQFTRHGMTSFDTTEITYDIHTSGAIHCTVPQFPVMVAACVAVGLLRRARPKSQILML